MSSRNGDVLVDLTGAVRNSNAGALVSNSTLKVMAASLDNSDNGILSGAGAQTFVIAGTLNNAQGGLIDSGAALDIQAKALDNTNATINAQQDISFTGTDLNNSTGTLAGNGAITLDLLGTLTNTSGKLASNGPLVIQRAQQINNQNGKLISQGLLSLLTGGLDNRNGGIVGANDLLTLTASGSVQNSAGGQIFSSVAGLTLNAASLDNAKGILQSQGDLTVKTGGAIDNQSGRIVATAGILDITAASLDSRGGVLSSLQGAFSSHITGVLRNGYDLNNNRQGGIIQAQSLDLKALAGIDNYGGRITAQTGDTIVDTGTNGSFDNRNGGLYAKGLVSVTAKDFDNSGDNDGQIGGKQIDLSLRGALNNRLGIIESESTLTISAASLDNQTGQLRALGGNGKTTFAIGGLFDNRNGAVESANTNLTLAAGSLRNVGGNVLHVGTGLLDIATGQLGSAGGNFVTRGGLTLTAASWTNSSVIQADRLTVNINSLNQTAGGQLLAVSTLTGNGGSWNNDGLIASDGSLSLTLGGTYSGNGRVSSLGTFGLSAAQLNLNAASSLAGGGNTTISVGGQLSNVGRLTSAADLTLTAGSVNNTGTVGAGKNLTLTTDALRNDRGLIFSGADMQLLSPSFTNYYGQVYSLGSLLIARDKKGTKADLLDNRSGGIESTGDLTIAVTTVNNVMDVLQYTEHEKSVATITQLSCTLISYGCDSRGGGRINGLWEIAETDRLKITLHSEAASINSGADLTINAGEVNNTSSSVTAAGDLKITASTINNKGVQEQDIETTRRFVSWVNETASAIGMADLFTQRNNPTPSATVEQDMSNFLAWMGETLPTSSRIINGESLDAIIQAGGNVTLDATQNINNSVVRPYYAYVAAGRTTTDTGAGSGYSTPIQINQQLAPDLAQQQVNPLTLPGFSLPTSQNGLFRLSQEGSTNPTATGPQSWTLTGASVTSSTSTPVTINRVQGLPNSAGKSQPHRYLIETNPVLTDLKQFMSSDYLLSGLGYDPDQSAKRLGDGLYEQKLVQQAVVARTGQRFIDGQTSDEALYKYLMNNAIASKDQLNLSLGVTLTSQQVAALTHDIVWLEEHEVNGEKVLVPVLYLANANNRLAANGALIQGSDVTLIAGKDLNNAGTLRASQNLDATAKNDLVSSGLLEAGDQLKVLATNNLTNKAGGIIAGRDVMLTATRGDVINERTVTSHDSSVGDYSHARDFVDNAARIEAANNLVINAGRDVLNTGGVLKSGGDMEIDAKRDVIITSVEERHSESRTNFLDSTLTQHGAEVSSGAGLTIDAGRDVAAVASKIDAKGDVTIEAKRDVFFGAAADEEHSYFKDKKETRQEDHISQIGTSLEAGGKLTLKSGKDMTLIASDISAGKEAYLHADGDLQLLAAQDSDYSLYDMKKKGGFGAEKTQRDEVTQITHIGTQIKSGGDLTLSSGGDQRYQVANLDSGKDIILDSGGAIIFEGVKDFHDESHTQSDGDAFWTSSKGKGNTDETLRQTQMIAKGNIVIKAVDGLKIDIKDVNQQSVSQTIDSMVKADPQLAWLKEAEARGDVDWRLVKEIHESFKYENSGLGPASQMIIAIIMAAVVGPAALTALSGMGTFWAATFAAVATGAATNATTSFINNGGNLGAVFADVTSSDALQGYVISGLTAGITANYLNKLTGATFDATGKYTGPSLATWKGVSTFAGSQILQGGTSAVITKALGGDANVSDVLKGALFNTMAAFSFNLVGDLTLNVVDDGSATKVAIHAMVGGLLAELTGGDFATGALAAGANEALVVELKNLVNGDPNLLLTASQIIGVLAATASGNADATSLQMAAWIANNATQYNYLNHAEYTERFEAEIACKGGDSNACTRRDELNKLDVERDKAIYTACKADLSSPACKVLRFESKKAEFDLLRNRNTPESREQLKLAMQDPELMRYSIDAELYSIGLMNNEVDRMLSTNIANKLMDVLTDGLPLIGSAKGFYEAESVWDYVLAALNIIPVEKYASDVVDGVKKVKELLKAGKASEADALLTEILKKTSDGKTITKITDEMKADPYHPDWKKYSGTEPRAVGADVVDFNAQASKNVKNVTAPIDFDGHVLNAEVKSGGAVVGGHSIATGDVKVIPGTATAPNAEGVYRAEIQVADPNNPGSFLNKTNNNGVSTMFPDSWTGDRVKVEVDEAFKNRIVSGGMWRGTTPSGVRVEGYLSPNTTVYPLY
ncbi:DUF637 domain-containing protein [Pseudomonas sp. NPDC087614]|uniref:DUF637 domain-containing protein n=1 Tax=Pseudomonas sp. NPDC087614 TaxID=3364442 RepID=UPI003823B0C5